MKGKASRNILFILLFSSIMLVAYAVMQYYQRADYKTQVEKGTSDIRSLEIQNTELRIKNDSIAAKIRECCGDTLTQKTETK